MFRFTDRLGLSVVPLIEEILRGVRCGKTVDSAFVADSRIWSQRCDLGLNFVYRVCTCIYLIFFVYVSICI